MPNNYFQFKQFVIHQENCAMKVGTDGVLLGAWTQIDDAKQVLDIGTGTGLISLMIAQRSYAKICGIEIDNEASIQAKQNVHQSPFKNRIEIIHQNFLEFVKNAENKFDLIVTNPPYFENALQSPQKERTTARHNTQLNYNSLIKSVSKIIDKQGEFAIIVPAEFESKIDALCFDEELFPYRICNVKPTPNKAPKRVLMQFSKVKKPLTKSSIIIETGKRHQYSEEYIELTKEFYLNF